MICIVEKPIFAREIINEGSNMPTMLEFFLFFVKTPFFSVQHIHY